MVQAVVKLTEHADRVLTIVKGKFGLKNKTEAINLVIQQYDEELLEPQLRPEYVKKIKNIEKHGKFRRFTSIEQLRKEIEKG